MATPAKRARSAPVPRATADERAKHFREDMYADGGVLFCKFWMPVASVDVAFLSTSTCLMTGWRA